MSASSSNNRRFKNHELPAARTLVCVSSDSAALDFEAETVELDMMDESGLRSRREFLSDEEIAAAAMKRSQATTSSKSNSKPKSNHSKPYTAGKYLVSEPIAAGGMASVHLGVASSSSSNQVIALKRLHPHLTTDQYFTTMLLDEARIAACVRHENVVTMHGAERIGGELFLVMEYVAGVPLNVLLKNVHPGAIPARYAAAIVAGMLRGLHAAHNATDASGRSLNIVHRDVSPQNVLVGTDGVPRVLDFGIAKAARRIQTTRAGEVKGKIAYMAPEQLMCDVVDRRTDVRAAAVVLWESLVGLPLFHAQSEGHTITKVLDGCTTPPSALVPGIAPELDAIVMRGLAQRPEDRFASAAEMADALQAFLAKNPVDASEVGAWVAQIGKEALRDQDRVRLDLRRRSSRPPPALPKKPLAPRLDMSMSIHHAPRIPTTALGMPAASNDIDVDLGDIDFEIPLEKDAVASAASPMRRSQKDVLTHRTLKLKPVRAAQSSRRLVEIVMLVTLVLLSALGGGMLSRHLSTTPLSTMR